jgi:predicted Mrr-cat superfamily restriction endonuclease
MLWMVRAFPDQTDRMTEFLGNNIIAVHWGISDLTGCATKKDVAEVVAQADLQPRDASLKTGLLHRFVNQMKIGDYCIIPYNDVFYTAKITSDYFYDSNSKKYEHQRQVEWLFDGEPFGREILPKQIQTSLKSQLGLADLSQHEPIFKRCINKWNSMDELGVLDLFDKSEESDETNLVGEQLSSLLNDAMKIIKDEINSDDPDRRLKAAIAVLELNDKQSLN